MKISVIVPTYRPQTYLWECLNSLCLQTLPKEDFEVILVLNGCCEPYKTQIQQYLNEHPELNVHFIQIDQGGVSNARNIALEVAKGEYVTFVDDDDFVSPEFLFELYKVATPELVSVCRPFAFIDGGGEKKDYPIVRVYAELYRKGITTSYKVRKYFSGPCMKLIPMSFIQDRRFDVRFKNGEDSIFMFLISDRIEKIIFSDPKSVYYRRFRKGSAVTVNRTQWQIISNNLKMIGVYCGIYFRAPWNYNIGLFVTRILSAIHSMMVGVRKI